MALIIEDGSVIAGANSFVTVDEIRAAAAARGIVLSEQDAPVEQAAIKAMDFIISLEPRMTGVRTDPANQDLPYPRTGVLLYSAEVLANGIPKTLKQAQAQLALDVTQGVPLFPDDTAEAAIKRDKTGPLETEYFAPGVASTGGALAAAFGYLSPLLVGNGFGLKTNRV